MSLLAAYLQGASLGLLLSLQVGPISLLCVRQALTQGMRTGIAVGLGATLADFIYASIAAFGLGGFGHLLAPWSQVLQSIGAGLIVIFGYQGWRSRHRPPDAATLQAGRRAFLSSFLLTLTNPLTILFFAGVFAGLGVPAQDPLAGLAVAAGVATTTFLWMALLAASAHRAARWLSPHRLVLVNGAASVALAALGVWLILRAWL